MIISNPNIREIGDNLETLAAKARLWFEKNNVSVPNGAKAWSKCSERRNEIPTGCSVNAIRRYGFNLTEFISQITGSGKHKHNYDPITKVNLNLYLGLDWLSSELVNGHKRIHTSCNLVLEVTSASNNIGAKYKETASWKMSLSDSVKFAYSLKEVEDIVRPLSKVSGLTVDHSGSLLRRSSIWR